MKMKCGNLMRCEWEECGGVGESGWAAYSGSAVESRSRCRVRTEEQPGVMEFGIDFSLMRWNLELVAAYREREREGGLQPRALH